MIEAEYTLNEGRRVTRSSVKAYDFMPTMLEPGWNPPELAHTPNKRISLANIEYGSRVFWDVMKRVCTC